MKLVLFILTLLFFNDMYNCLFDECSLYDVFNILIYLFVMVIAWWYYSKQNKMDELEKDKKLSSKSKDR